MSRLQDVARPGLMLSQTWPRSREHEGDTEKAFQIALENESFTSFQTVEIPYPRERKTIARLLEQGDFAYDYCVARVLNENSLNLSDPDVANRRRSVEKVIDCLNDAREAGAQTLTVISGPRPEGDEQRKEALTGLSDSLAQIALEAAKEPALGIVIEPLDVIAHKRMTLGYTIEAMAMCRRLRADGLQVSLLLDTAHMILNEEDPAQSLQEAMDVTATFHYCNCVTDRAHSLFGDRHMRFGAPGVLDIPEIAAIMRAQTAMGFFSAGAKRPVMCEVLKQEGEDPGELLAYCATIMESAWKATSGS